MINNNIAKLLLVLHNTNNLRFKRKLRIKNGYVFHIGAGRSIERALTKPSKKKK